MITLDTYNMLSIQCMLFGLETLDTHDMSNKCIQSNFFVVIFI